MLNLADIGGLSSTLVETVSLDVDDFSDNFLTCGTCLCVYDSTTRTPKLLPCSHTVCLSCARTIHNAAVSASTRSQCPVCSGVFTVPAVGPAALPPSFVVNQLLDLMASGTRRDVVPKCAVHLSCQLLFCETCDKVFCAECEQLHHGVNDVLVHSSPATSTARSSSVTNAAHNVVPFAIAIRRVCEILQYKARQCASNLDTAAVAVQAEIDRLDIEAERCVQTVDRAFDELTTAVQQCQHAVTGRVETICQDKTRVLEEQLALISAERQHVQAECNGLPTTDIRSITSRITKLNELLHGSTFLAEPRENAYLNFTDAGDSKLHEAIRSFGAVRTSETFPALCTVEFTDPCITTNLRSQAYIVTYDANGCRQSSGGDPVTVELVDALRHSVDVFIVDQGDGSYELTFTARTAGLHSLTVKIFDRVVGTTSPITFTATQYHSALSTFTGLHQPVAVAVYGSLLYVLDTGNSRLPVYDLTASVTCPARSIVNESLVQRGATGMSLVPITQPSSDNTLCPDADNDMAAYVINWRTSCVSQFYISAGLVQHSFHCPDFIEPTSITVTNDLSVYVADNARHCIFVFAPCGKLTQTIELPATMDLVTCIYASPIRQEVLVCDQHVRALSYAGEFLYKLPPGDSRGHGQYGGVVVDSSGRYIASRSERGRAMLQVFASDQTWLYSIECRPDGRLRRPSGLAVDPDGHVFVADLGNNCVRKFRYL